MTSETMQQELLHIIQRNSPDFFAALAGQCRVLREGR